MEHAPRTESSDDISPEEYADLIAERAQLQIQLGAAHADSSLPSDVASGVEDRLADVQRYIEQFEQENPDKIITTTPSEPTQGELALLPEQDEMDPERFSGDGRPPAYERRN
jgi:hypothetical protein